MSSKTSSRYNCKTSSSRHLQDVLLQIRLEDLLKTSWRRLGKTFWIRPWKRSCRHVFKTSWRTSNVCWEDSLHDPHSNLTPKTDVRIWGIRTLKWKLLQSYYSLLKITRNLKQLYVPLYGHLQFSYSLEWSSYLRQDYSQRHLFKLYENFLSGQKPAKCTTEIRKF